MLADTDPDGQLLGTKVPLAFAAGWADAFHQSGRAPGDWRAGNPEPGAWVTSSPIT